MTTDTTGTTMWQKAGSLYSQRVTVTGERNGLCYVKFVRSGERSAIPLDPATGGPRGYVKCEEATP